jgi:hypothetical protein
MLASLLHMTAAILGISRRHIEQQDDAAAIRSSGAFEAAGRRDRGDDGAGLQVKLTLIRGSRALNATASTNEIP